MRLSVIGANGFLGEALVAAARESGSFECQPITRQPVADLRSVGVGDLAADPSIEALKHALRDHRPDVIVNAAGISNWSQFGAVRQAATIARNALAAAEGRDFIQVSSTSATASTTEAKIATVYAHAKREAEEVVWRGGLRWPGTVSIVRLGQLGPATVRLGRWPSHPSILKHQIKVSCADRTVRIDASALGNISPVDMVAERLLNIAFSRPRPFMTTLGGRPIGVDAMKAAAGELGYRVEIVGGETGREILADQLDLPPLPQDYPDLLLKRIIEAA